MKIKYRFFFIFICITLSAKAQKQIHHSNVQADYFYGNILALNKSVSHMITGHPTGVILSWNRESYGKKAWQERYNYPDFGTSLVSQDFKNNILGKAYGFYAHSNIYFGNRKKIKNNFILRLGAGLTYVTNPYNKVNNSKNTAFGSHINASLYGMLYYKRYLFHGFSMQTGLDFIHSSNGNTIAPNNGINIYSASLGMHYNFNYEDKKEYIHREKSKFTEPIKYNFIFRTGMNEAEIVNAGIYPFFTGSFYADKRISHSGAIQFGTDVFVSLFLKEYIRFNNAINKENNNPYQYTRVGIVTGYEFFFDKISLVGQLGFYAYDPVDYETSIYERIEIKYYFNKKIFTAFSLKAHAARAESLEFSIGYRL